MTGADRPPVIIVTGPTASGKSAVALACARAIGAEIVCADSRQVYRGLDIGTAKPTPAERADVPHHCLDLRDPHESYSASDWVTEALAAIGNIHARGRRAVVAGGTGLYVRLLMDGLFEGGTPDPALRAALEAELAERGHEALHAELTRLDPAGAPGVPATNHPRLIRALEVCRLTGRPFSAVRSERRIPALRFRLFGLRWERAALYARIDRRVEDMVAAGFPGEVRGLLAAGVHPGLPAMNSVGYREFAAWADGACTLEDAVARTQMQTRRFAKRQLTWFRAETRLRWLDVAGEADLAAAAEAILHTG